jgi:hypothetical protein
MGGAPTELDLENCLTFNNGFGGVKAENSSGMATTRVRISNSTVLSGGFVIGISNAFLLSRGNNTVEPTGTSPGTYSAK